MINFVYGKVGGNFKQPLQLEDLGKNDDVICVVGLRPSSSN